MVSTASLRCPWRILRQIDPDRDTLVISIIQLYIYIIYHMYIFLIGDRDIKFVPAQKIRPYLYSHKFEIYIYIV